MAGGHIELGDTLGYVQEPCDRWGRLVGIRRNPDREIERYIVREFTDGDGRFPTGDYATTSIIGMAEWRCPTCSGPTRETVSMVCQTCGTDYAAGVAGEDEP